MKTAYATIKGIEVMRALRKGQASAFYYGDPLGEMRLVSRAQRLGVTHLPALFLVEPGAERYQPLAYGFMTQDDLMKRFLSVATDFAPRS